MALEQGGNRFERDSNCSSVSSRPNRQDLIGGCNEVLVLSSGLHLTLIARTEEQPATIYCKSLDTRKVSIINYV